MTIASEVRKAGPYEGNGVATSFPFPFKVFSADDVVVILTDPFGDETILTGGADYSVTLNADQDAAPGGSVEKVSALATGYLLTITSSVPNLQPLDLTNQGGFYPKVINAALDRLTILAQQNAEQIGRSVKVPISSSVTPDSLIAQLTQDATSAATSATAAATAKAAAETARDAAVTAKDTATTQAGNASGFATAAEAAKTAAETAKGLAEAAKNTATTQAGNASGFATAAETAKTAAETAKGLAETAKDTATTQATNAANSATAASGSATAAASSKTAAEAAQGLAEVEKDLAAISATNAASSATNAANSAVAASGSATAAAGSATSAATSATAAGTAKTAAETAKGLAEAAKEAATTQAGNAASSATAAAGSAASAAAAVSAHESAGDPHPQYQVDLVSGTNIKTINNQSILGAGNITVGQMAGFIGVQGGQGFGVGIYPFDLPSGFSALDGSENPASANYGNYQYSDGSILVFVPRFYYRIGSASSPRYATYGANAIDIVGIDTYATEAGANTAGYAMHRAFKDGGADKSGFFIDKYLASKNGTTSCKSVPNGVPISLTTNSTSWNSSSGMTTGEGSCTGTLADAVLLARSRLVGTFNAASVFMYSALALLSLAHAQASSNTTYCAWYDATNNFPKGCNNSLADTNDAGVTFTTAGDSGNANKPLTGSGSPFAKTTHNGQACGVADLNGTIYQVMLGITNAGANATDTTQKTDGDAYVLKTSVALSSLTYGWNGANDAWGDATNLATKYDLETGLFPWGATTGSTCFGSGSNQVFSGATSGISWKRTACGIQDTTSGTSGSGTNQFGKDGCAQNNRANLCVTSATNWDGGAAAGVFSRSWANSKSHVSGHFGFRAGAYGS